MGRRGLHISSIRCILLVMTVSITIRNVPDDVRNELAARAAGSGRSLQEYLRIQLIEMSSRPDPTDVVARIRNRKSRTQTRQVPASVILEDLAADRR